MDESINLRLKERLAGLFRQASSEHHQAFLATNGFDPEWPSWYASHLKDRLSEVLAVQLTQTELASWLAEADQAHRRQAPEADWSGYYADFFLERLG